MTDGTVRWSRILRAAAHPPALAAERDVAVQEALDAAASTIVDTVGCSITEMVDDRFRTPAASSSLALTLDLAQYEAGTGPCIVACRDGRAQSIAVMANHPGYAGFAAAAVAHDVLSSLSLPLTHTERPSALNLYASSAAAFEDQHGRRVAELLARCLTPLLPGPARGGPVDPDSPEGLQSAQLASITPSRVQVIRARELLQHRHGISAEQAFRRLTQLSQEQQCSIVAVAREIVRTAEGRSDQ